MSLQSTSEAIQSCLTTAQIIQYHAFPFENHIIETSNGFLLGIHRIPNKNPESRVVLIWHGLWYPTKSTGSILNRVFSTSSETFVSNPHMESNLAFHLSTLGFDVWLGNSRGNKYTSHVQHKNTDEAFWDFGIDELAKYDLPETVEFIVKKTGKSKLSYIGFSQGSAQGFIALSSNEVLRSRIDCFIALAAALKPKRKF